MYGDALREFAAASGDGVAQLLARASGMTMGRLLHRLAEMGHSSVRMAHVAVFSSLDPDGTRISDLAARAGISRQAMSVLVRDLEASGYVRSAPDPSDRRAIIVELDRLGAEFCRAAVVASAELDTDAEATVGGAELEQVRQALKAIIGSAATGPSTR
ncbi:MarR family winged helix-turn-helix transcriptional regulator [Agromyces neolithicus]|uniref:Winged helix DNA-binding protein n=1 Tax=Agromyces neolithicus TaxID=269420 RepID=A0ABN2LWL5_9MICO